MYILDVIALSPARNYRNDARAILLGARAATDAADPRLPDTDIRLEAAGPYVLEAENDVIALVPTYAAIIASGTGPEKLALYYMALYRLACMLFPLVHDMSLAAEKMPDYEYRRDLEALADKRAEICGMVDVYQETLVGLAARPLLERMDGSAAETEQRGDGQ